LEGVSIKAVVLAGGRGTRLAPYTTVLPKPLMPIGDIPVLDVVIRQLVRAGATEVILSVGYLAELIMAYCGDGSRYPVKLTYVREESPLGTVGPLGLIPGLNETFFLLNGDVITTLDLGALLAFHRREGAALTVAVNRREVQINYGVVERLENNEIRAYKEKPTLEYLVGMGICVFEPAALRMLTPGEKLDVPELLARCFKAGVKVAGYLSNDYWLDIGRIDDYQQAVTDFESMKDRLLGTGGSEDSWTGR
jgi:NDP-sugar pyrophosphorylase family protein